MITWDRALTSVALTLVASLLTIVPVGTVTTAPTASAATAAAAAPAAPRWRPIRGPIFNNPIGSKKARHVIANRVKQAIRHSRRGSTIRFSTYSFDRKDVASELIRARRRGVNVQVVVNDNIISKQELRLQRFLGKNIHRKSFFVFCKGSCRSGGGNLHIKIYSFSQTGAAKNVMVTSSGNLAYGGSFAQWNDAFLLYGDARLFKAWVRVFNQLKRDRKSTPRQVTYSSKKASVYFHRELARSAAGGQDSGDTEVRAARKGSGDPVIARLSKIGCKAPRGFGLDGRTVVKFAVYAWYGRRGDAIARKAAELQRRGCRVKVIGSVLGASTGRLLLNAGIPVKAADWDFGDRPSTGDEDKIVYGPRCYMHYKFFTVNGKYGGKPLAAVWTGSENWSGISFANDEVTLRLNGRPIQAKYAKQFNVLWGNPNATHSFGIEPTRRPCAYN